MIRASSDVNDRALALVDEISGACCLEQFRGQPAGFAPVLGQRQHLIDQVARLAASKRDLAWCVVALEEMLDKAALERQIPLLAAVLENAGELRHRRTLREHF